MCVTRYGMFFPVNYQQTTMESFSIKTAGILFVFSGTKKGGKLEKTVAFLPELCYDNCCVIKKREVNSLPNIKSAKKRVKVIAKKTERNKAVNSAMKTDIKKANIAIETGADNKTEAVRVAIRAIDKAAAKGILHKNTAARKKSALAKKLNA